MADTAALKALRARVAEATGPDRDLDADICVALQYCPDDASDRDGRSMVRADEMIVIIVDGRWSFGPPKLTGSVDAALALSERVMPEELWGLIRLDRPARIGRTTVYGARCGWRGLVNAVTPPLAILAATLDALIAQTEEAR